MAAVYLTIWVALVLFVAAEAARARASRVGAPPPWAWWAFTAGLALAIIHTLLSFAIVHDWSHEDAVRSTARQTAAVLGVSFGSGVYVNYVFFGAWLADAVWWRIAPAHRRSAAITWTLRAFYLLIVANAAVIFVQGWRRAVGIAVTAALVAAWSRGSGSR